MLVTGLVLTGVALSATGAFLGLRVRGSRVEEVHRFRCPGCTQKLRYAASRAGRTGMCPRCRKRWTFPSNPEILPSALDACGGYQVKVGRRRMAGTSGLMR
jgi:hypothetical protein